MLHEHDAIIFDNVLSPGLLGFSSPESRRSCLSGSRGCSSTCQEKHWESSTRQHHPRAESRGGFGLDRCCLAARRTGRDGVRRSRKASRRGPGCFQALSTLFAEAEYVTASTMRPRGVPNLWSLYAGKPGSPNPSSQAIHPSPRAQRISSEQRVCQYAPMVLRHDPAFAPTMGRQWRDRPGAGRHRASQALLAIVVAGLGA